MNILSRSFCKKTGASSLSDKEMIQELWNAYGTIMRVGLENTAFESLVVKPVQLPTHTDHPRGWNTGICHQRKVSN